MNCSRNNLVVVVLLFSSSLILIFKVCTTDGPVPEILISPDSSIYTSHSQVRYSSATDKKKKPKIVTMGVNPMISHYGNKLREEKCPYHCIWSSDDNTETGKADLLVLKGWRNCWKGSSVGLQFYQPSYTSLTAPDQCKAFSSPTIFEWPKTRHNKQLWLFLLDNESPARSHNGADLAFTTNQFNYTITFKRDSTFQYGYRHLHGYWPIQSVKKTKKRLKDFAAEKSKQILWYVSNCKDTKVDRLKFAQHLAQYVDIDIFGRCTGFSDGCRNRGEKCVTKVRKQYKFYLAFENSLCEDYITEKLWSSYLYESVPIALGGLSKNDYERALAPEHSYIHIDDFSSIQELANYLKYLISNDTAYNEYHNWRRHMTFPRNKVKTDDESKELYRKTRERLACEICRLASTRPANTVNLSQFWNQETSCRDIPYI